jgi:hypothetical protein
MTRLHLAYKTGRTIHGKARTSADAYIESNILLTEAVAGNGVYDGDTAAPLNVGDYVAAYDILTSDVQPVGFAEYDYTNEKVISDIAVQDISLISDMIGDIYSDTTVIIAKANSDMVILKSDIENINNTTSDMVSDMTSFKNKTNSDLTSVLSDIATVMDEVRITVHEYHL